MCHRMGPWTRRALAQPSPGLPPPVGPRYRLPHSLASLPLFCGAPYSLPSLGSPAGQARTPNSSPHVKELCFKCHHVAENLENKSWAWVWPHSCFLFILVLRPHLKMLKLRNHSWQCWGTMLHVTWLGCLKGQRPPRCTCCSPNCLGETSVSSRESVYLAVGVMGSDVLRLVK